MSNIRLYVRSIHRVIINIKTIFSDAVNIFINVAQITSNKEKIIKKVNLSKAKLEEKRKVINTENVDTQIKIINFVR